MSTNQNINQARSSWDDDQKTSVVATAEDASSRIAKDDSSKAHTLRALCPAAPRYVRAPAPHAFFPKRPREPSLSISSYPFAPKIRAISRHTSSATRKAATELTSRAPMMRRRPSGWRLASTVPS